MNTRSPNKPTARRYAQFCPLARALDVVGQRWTLLIIRNLLVGPQRYGEMMESLPGITTNLLAKRLKEMVDTGLLSTRSVHGVTLYELTPRARELEPAVLLLANWGEKEPFPENGHRNLRWVMLGIRRRYEGGLEGSLRLQATDTEKTFLLLFDEDEVSFSEDGREATTTVSAPEAALIPALYRMKPWRQLEKSKALSIEGDRKFFDQVLGATS